MEQQQILLNELDKEEKIAFFALIKHVMRDYHIFRNTGLYSIVVHIPFISNIQTLLCTMEALKSERKIKNRYCKSMNIKDSFFSKSYSSMDEILDEFKSEKSKKIALVEIIKFLNQDIFYSSFHYGYSRDIIDNIAKKFKLDDFIDYLNKHPEEAKKFQLDTKRTNIFQYEEIFMKAKEAVSSKLNKQEKVAVIDLLRHFINNVGLAYVPFGYGKPFIERSENCKIYAILEEYRISLGVKDEDCRVKIRPFFTPRRSLNEVSLNEILKIFKGIKVHDMVSVEILYFKEKLKSSSVIYDDFRYSLIIDEINTQKNILKAPKMNDIEMRDFLENLDEKERKKEIAAYSSDYLSLVLEYGNTDELLEAIETITKMKGFIQVQKNTRLEKESLYKPFFKGTIRRFDNIGRYCAPLM